jgi:hypothetical protein
VPKLLTNHCYRGRQRRAPRFLYLFGTRTEDLVNHVDARVAGARDHDRCGNGVAGHSAGGGDSRNVEQSRDFFFARQIVPGQPFLRGEIASAWLRKNETNGSGTTRTSELADVGSLPRPDLQMNPRSFARSRLKSAGFICPCQPGAVRPAITSKESSRYATTRHEPPRADRFGWS